jgi:hypothetical protein
MTNPTYNPGNGGFAYFNSYSFAKGVKIRLFQKCGFNFTGVGNPTVSFQMSHDNGYSTGTSYCAENAQLMYSTDGGLTYTLVDSVLRADSTLTTTTPDIRTHTFSIPALANQSNVIIAIDGVSQYGNNFIIDSIAVYDGGAVVIDSILPFTLVSPTSGTSITVNPTTTYTITWNKAVRTSGNPAKYTWMLDAANGNFSSPLVSVVPGPATSGTDTFLNIPGSTIITLLAANGVNPGQTFNGKWTVRATGGNATPRFADQPFTINLTNPTIADTLSSFALLSPANNANVSVLPSSQALTIKWNSSKRSTQGAVTYTWKLDNPNGNFSTPVASLPSNNSGSDTTLTLTASTINTALASVAPIGVAKTFIWTVTASSATLSQNAVQSFTLTITRLNDSLTVFSLVGPANNASLQISGAPSQTAVINWRASRHTSGNPVTYTWLLDAASGNFSAPLASIPSNNNGNDTAITLTFGQIATLLANNNVNAGVAFNGKWTVRATSGTDSKNATTPFNITLTRSFLTSASELNASQAKIYPNPSEGAANLYLNLEKTSNVLVQVLDLNGRQVSKSMAFEMQSGTIQLPAEGLSAGMYVVSISVNGERTFVKWNVQ